MILSALHFVFTIFLVLCIFNLMIIVHELGHFLAAKWRGLVAEEFGVWFGKPIWRKKIGGVWYSLGTIPFGGFVKLPQLAAMDGIEGKSDSAPEELPYASPLNKIIVAFAGPLFSFLLAASFATIVWIAGRPVSESESTTTIGYVEPKMPAAEAGLKAGDKILEIDGHKIARWGGMGSDSIAWRIVSSEGETLEMKVERDGQVLPIKPKPEVPETKVWERRAQRQIGISAKETPVIGEVNPGTPAAQAGFKRGDQLLAVNGKPILNPMDLQTIVGEHPGEPARFIVKRGDKKNGYQTLEAPPISARGELVGDVFKDSPAAKAGVKPNDLVVSINGEAFQTAAKFSELIKANGQKPLTMNIEREGQPLTLTMTPVPPEGKTEPFVGLQWGGDDYGWAIDQEGITQLVYPGPAEQLEKSALAIYEMIRAISSRKSNISIQHMSGPVMMVHAYYSFFTFFQPEYGWRYAIWFSVVLNVNLAILNLLPIPPLDGSHITLSIIEAIRRRPMSGHFVEYVQTACTVAIIGFMLYIVFFDVQDLPFFSSKQSSLKFSGKSATPAATTNK